MREFHVNLGFFLLKLENFGNLYEIRTEFVPISYESRANFVRISSESGDFGEIRRKRARHSHKFRTNLPNLHEFRTNFLQIRLKFVRNLYQFLEFRPKGPGMELPDFCWAQFGPDGFVWDGTFIESWGLKMKLDFCPL